MLGGAKTKNKKSPSKELKYAEKHGIYSIKDQSHLAQQMAYHMDNPLNNRIRYVKGKKYTTEELHKGFQHQRTKNLGKRMKSVSKKIRKGGLIPRSVLSKMKEDPNQHFYLDLNNRLPKEEDAIFMFYEIFHDFINDKRGGTEPRAKKSDNLIFKETFEAKFNALAAELLVKVDNYPLSHDDMRQVHKEILRRLSEKKYGDFEKLLLMRIVDHTAKNEVNMSVLTVPGLQLNNINFVFHDAGHEEIYRTSGVTNVSSLFSKIDQWDNHPHASNHQLILQRDHMSEVRRIGGLNMVSEPPIVGEFVKLKFSYFNEKKEIAFLHIKVNYQGNLEGVSPYFTFDMSFDGNTFESFPRPTPVHSNLRQKCFSVFEAKAYMREHLKIGGCACHDPTKFICNEAIKILALKAIGDKIIFLEALNRGTTDNKAQAAAITHDRLSACYLLRDMAYRTRKQSFIDKSNLIIPVYYYNINIGPQGGITFTNKEQKIIGVKGSPERLNISTRDEASQHTYFSRNAYQMGRRNERNSFSTNLTSMSEQDIRKLSRQVIKELKSRKKKKQGKSTSQTSSSQQSGSRRPRSTKSRQSSPSQYKVQSRRKTKKKPGTIRIKRPSKTPMMPTIQEYNPSVVHPPGSYYRMVGNFMGLQGRQGKIKKKNKKKKTRKNKK